MTYLSVIIPAYNESRTLPACVRSWVHELSLTGRPYEILIVENGSSDDTYPVARELAGQYGHVYAYTVPVVPRQGKGRAVQYGMLMARGTWRYMADADLSCAPEEIRRFLRAAENGWPVIIGSRAVPGAIVDTSAQRLVSGRIFAAIVELLLGLGIRDTQCGFKMFHDDVAVDLFSDVTMPGWAFDVELLHKARQLDVPILELPVRWKNAAGSRVSLLVDSLRMLLDVIAISRLHRRARQSSPRELPA